MLLLLSLAHSLALTLCVYVYSLVVFRETKWFQKPISMHRQKMKTRANCNTQSKQAKRNGGEIECERDKESLKLSYNK